MKANIKQAIIEANASALAEHIHELEYLLETIKSQAWRGVDTQDYSYHIAVETINEIDNLLMDKPDAEN